MRSEINHEKLQTMMHDPSSMFGRHMERMGVKLRMLAMMQAGMKTGQTRALMFSRVSGGAGGMVLTVGSNGEAALYHHQGTKSHLILPKYAKTLRFKVNGRIVYAKVVHHPGTRPNRYLTDNMRKVL